MIQILDKFKIPTLLGLGLIFLGIGSGVFLVLRNQTFISQATPDQSAQNINFTNIDDSSVTVSFQTSTPTTAFATFGQQSLQEQTALDERDSQGPESHNLHHLTLKNLLPKTTYSVKIFSGKTTSEILTVTTAAPASSQNGFTPVIGSVLSGDAPLDEGIAFLSISGAITQSALVKNGNFLIPISEVRKADLSDIYPLNEDTIAKITVVSPKEEVTILFKLKTALSPLPSVKLGQNLDLTNSPSTPQPTTSDIDKYDLNGDKKINAADNAILLQNFGKNPKNNKADITGLEGKPDGKVDKIDLDALSQKIKELGSQP